MEPISFWATKIVLLFYFVLLANFFVVPSVWLVAPASVVSIALVVASIIAYVVLLVFDVQAITVFVVLIVFSSVPISVFASTIAELLVLLLELSFFLFALPSSFRALFFVATAFIIPFYVVFLSFVFEAFLILTSFVFPSSSVLPLIFASLAHVLS